MSISCFNNVEKHKIKKKTIKNIHCLILKLLSEGKSDTKWNIFRYLGKYKD